MTRRYPDISRPRGSTSTATAIGAGLAMLTGVIVLVIVGIILAAIFSRVAHSRDAGQWEETPAPVREWYRSLKQPDNPAIPCCGEADAYWCDHVNVVGSKVTCTITDDRPDEPLRRPHVDVGTVIQIPAHKYKFDRGNPTGHTVVFLSLHGDVYCFVQNGGV